MTRDRISQLRNAAKEGEFDSTGDQINGETTALKPVPAFMEDFFDQIDEIRSIINQIALNVSEVKKTHSAILNSTHAKDSERMRKDLDSIMAGITVSSRTVQAKLKDIEKKIENEGQTNSADADLRIRKVQHMTLSQKFIDVMTEYNAHQVQFREQCKDRIKRQMTITKNKSITDDQIEDMLEDGNLSDFTQGIIVQTQQTKQLLQDIEDRHEDLLRLERSIRELHDMFVDISTLIQQQGEMINSIEYNIAQTQNYVESAKQETHKAVTYQKRARKKKMCIIICVVVAVLLLALILGLSIGLR